MAIMRHAIDEEKEIVKSRCNNSGSDLNKNQASDVLEYMGTKGDKCKKCEEEQKFSCYKDITNLLFTKLEEDIGNNGAEGFDIDTMLGFFLGQAEKNFSCCQVPCMDFNAYVKHCEKHHQNTQHTKMCHRDCKSTGKDISNDMRQYMTKISKNRLRSISMNKTVDLRKNDDWKRYKCDYEDCEKRFKSVSGQKYHIEHTHLHDRKKDDDFFA